MVYQPWLGYDPKAFDRNGEGGGGEAAVPVVLTTRYVAAGAGAGAEPVAPQKRPTDRGPSFAKTGAHPQVSIHRMAIQETTEGKGGELSDKGGLYMVAPGFAAEEEEGPPPGEEPPVDYLGPEEEEEPEPGWLQKWGGLALGAAAVALTTIALIAMAAKGGGGRPRKKNGGRS